jgi:hypothetical protein
MSVFAQDVGFSAAEGFYGGGAPSRGQTTGVGPGVGGRGIKPPPKGGYNPGPPRNPAKPRGFNSNLRPNAGQRLPLKNPQAAGQVTSPRPFTPKVGRPGTKGSGFSQLLKGAGVSGNRALKGGQGFAPKAPIQPARNLSNVPVSPAEARVPRLSSPAKLDTPWGLPLPPLPQFNPFGGNLPKESNYTNQLPLDAINHGEIPPGANIIPYTLPSGIFIRGRAPFPGSSTPGTTKQSLLSDNFVRAYWRPNPGWYSVLSLQASDGTHRDFSNQANSPLYRPSNNEMAATVLAGVELFRYTTTFQESLGFPNQYVGDFERTANPTRAQVASPTLTPRVAPSPLPANWPFSTPSPDPAKQPLPYIPTENPDLRKGAGDLPDEYINSPQLPQTFPSEFPTTTDSTLTLPGATVGPSGQFTTGGSASPLGGTATSLTNQIQPQTQGGISTPVIIHIGTPTPPHTPVDNFDPGLTGGSSITPSLQIIPPNISQQPPNPPGDCKPDPRSFCKYDEKGIAGKCDDILKKFDEDYSLEWDLPECENEFSCTRNGREEGKGLDGLAAQIGALYEAIKVLHDNTRCSGGDALAIPETWEIKKELESPQLVITTKIPGDKTSFRRSISIPHPRISTEEEARVVFSERRQYKRGNHLSMIVLKDNSKIMLNVDGKATGEELLDWISGHIVDPNYIETEPGVYRHVQNPGREIIPTTVELYTVTYYSRGRKDDLPDWIITIPS